jgi:hypothetical protein
MPEHLGAIKERDKCNVLLTIHSNFYRWLFTRQSPTPQKSQPTPKSVFVTTVSNENRQMFPSTLLVLLFSPLVWLVYRIVEWQQRLARVRQTMPAYGLWLEPYSLLRRLVPKQWLKFHPDWQFQDRRTFDSLGTNIIPIVCLFGHDSFYISDPEAVVEIYSNMTRFPKDLKLYGMEPRLFVRLMDKGCWRYMDGMW